MSDSVSSQPDRAAQTPVRRLGLCRKRKSIASENTNKNIEESPNSSAMLGGVVECSAEKIPKHSETPAQDCNKLELKSHTVPGNGGESESVKAGTSVEGSEAQSTVPTSNLTIKCKELEELNAKWLRGCKESLLYLIDLLEKRQGGTVNVMKLLQSLGVWKVLFSHFKDDCDLDLSQYENQEEIL